jgi:large subunit ribosomal protein L3
MGGEQVTTKGLTVFSVDAENNLILIRGAVPGANDQLVLVYKTADKAGKA